MRTGYELRMRGEYRVRCLVEGTLYVHAESAAQALALLEEADRECDCGQKHEIEVVLDVERLRDVVRRDPRTRGVNACSLCGQKGHNARRCADGSRAAA